MDTSQRRHPSLEALPLSEVILSVAAAALDTVVRLVGDKRFDRHNPSLAERLEDIGNTYLDVAEWLSDPSQEEIAQERPDIELFSLRRPVAEDERSLAVVMSRLRDVYGERESDSGDRSEPGMKSAA